MNERNLSLKEPIVNEKWVNQDSQIDYSSFPGYFYNLINLQSLTQVRSYTNNFKNAIHEHYCEAAKSDIILH